MIRDRLCGLWRGGGRTLRLWLRLYWPVLVLMLLLGLCLMLRDAGTVTIAGFAVLAPLTRTIQDGPHSGVTTEATLEVMREERSPKYKVVLPGCPATPPGLLGRLKVVEKVSVSDVEARQRVVVRAGGRWWPEECEARWRLAVIVPYRDRQHQIGPFLNHMHPFLQRQQLNYSIYFVEQAGSDLFNRARLLNVGFLEAVKEGPWDCYAFHDVDMLPENDHHLYHCSPQPRHLAVATSINNYKDSAKLPYNTYFGGACLMAEAHLRRVNGWSNIYWGWGGEDDDMWRRIKFTDMRVWRYPPRVARYTMIRHRPQPVNELSEEITEGNMRPIQFGESLNLNDIVWRWQKCNPYRLLKRNTGRYPRDGLSTLNYTVTTTRLPLYTHLLAHIGASTDPTGDIVH